MSIKLNETNGGKLLEVEISGTIVEADYTALVPTVDSLVKAHGKIRLLVEMHDFHGWTAGAAWEDIKFDVKHFNDIESLAIVGETKWEHVMAIFCKPFTNAKVRYFDRSEVREARAWLESS